MSFFPGTPDGPWLQGLTSFSGSLQGDWESNLVSYSSANYVATLTDGLKADWVINQNFQDTLSSGQFASYAPTSPGGNYWQYALGWDWDASGAQRGSEDMHLCDSAAAGIWGAGAYLSNYPTRGGLDRFTTLAELKP